MRNLFSTITIKNLELKNRIVMAPMCMYHSDDHGKVKDFHKVHYGARALGGVGLILLESTAVEKRGRISAKDLGIWSDDHVAALKELVDLIHDSGAKVGVQLGHAGRKCGVQSETIIGPSSVSYSDDYKTPKEMDATSIKEAIEAFKKGAKRAHHAGFDTIELHGAHGYLINQFLSPLSNHRKDEYGGSIENRSRFLKEILEGVKKVWPSDKPVILRISAEDYHKEGNHYEDLVKIINHVKSAGLDLINVSSGGVAPAKIQVYPGYQAKLGENIKKMTGLPVMSGGLITRAEMAEELIRNERSDLVFLGRELLRNPNWPLFAREQLLNEACPPKPYERAVPFK